MPNYINNNVYHVYSTLNVSLFGNRYVAILDSAGRVDSDRHRHNLIIVLQHSPVSRQQLPSLDMSCRSWEKQARRHLTSC